MRFSTLSMACCVALGYSAFSSHAANYYFSSTSGNDAYKNSNTVNARQNTGPWKSLAKLATITLNQNDIIYLECGSIWRESLNLVGGTGGKVGNGVSIKSYSSGLADPNCANKPSIRGSDELRSAPQSWTAPANNSAIRYISWAGVTAPEQLFVNDQPYLRARFPNANTNPNNYALVTAGTLNSVTLSSTDKTAVGMNDLKGATVHLRPQLWLVTTRQVQSYSNGLVTLDRALDSITEPMRPGDGVVFENRLWMVNAEKEWFYDSAASMLYVQPPVNSTWPAVISTELTVRPKIVTVENVADFTIQNIDLRHAKTNALQILNSPRAKVDKVDVSYAGVGENTCFNSGIYIGANWPAGKNTPEFINDCQWLQNSAAATGSSITQSNLRNNGRSAIVMLANQATVSNNKIYDTGTSPNFYRNALASVSVGGDVLVVSNNTIDNSAYNAISFLFKGNTTISGNTISKFCVRYADCGAIYTFNSGAVDKGPVIAEAGISYIKGNTIRSGFGDTQGSDNPERNLVAGIYLDAYSNNVSITDNVISEAGIGLYLNSAYSNTASGNWIHGARRAALYAADGNGKSTRNNKIQNNVFHAYNRFEQPVNGKLPVRNDGVAQAWYHPSDPTKLFTTDTSLTGNFQLPNVVSNNTVVDAGSKTTQWRVSSKGGLDEYFIHNVSLGKWKSLSGATDKLTQPVGSRLFNPTAPGVSSEIVKSWDFNAGTLSGWFVQNGSAFGTATVAAVPGCVGTCANVSFNQNVDFYSGEFDLTGVSNDTVYHLEYLAVGTTGSIAAVNIDYNNAVLPVRENDWSHELGTGVQGAVERRWVEGFFQHKALPARAGMMMRGRGGSTTALDQVRVTKVNSGLTAASLYNPSAYTGMYYNSDTKEAIYACPGNICNGLVDENGLAVALRTRNTFALPAGTKKMVFAPPPAPWAR